MINVCLSGFEPKERTLIAEYLRECGINQASGMNFDVHVLVCNSVVRNDKYKVAKILGIDVVSPSWVYACYEQKAVLDRRPYALKQFSKASLCLLGFTDNEYEQLSSFIIENDGTIKRHPEESQIVVFKKNTQYEFDSKLKALPNVILVDSDWLYQCHLRQQFVPTTYYQYNQPKVDHDELLPRLKNSKVSEALNKPECMSYRYLQGLVFYVAIKDDQLTRVLHQLVSIGDGLFVTMQLPIVTHIVYLYGSSESIQNLSAKIVHPMWLFDCLYFRKRVNEQDYQVKMNVSSQQTSLLNSFKNSQEDFEKNRDSFLLGKVPATKPFIEEPVAQTNHFGLRSSSFGAHTSSNNHSLANKVEKSQSKDQLRGSNHLPILNFNRFSTISPKNNLFGQCYFYVFDHPSLDRSILTTIQNFGGLSEKMAFPIKQKPNQVKGSKDRTFHVFLFPDSSSCKEVIQKLEKEYPLQGKKYYSYRWVPYCIEKNLLEMQVSKKGLMQLLPINQSTPFQELQGQLIYVSVKDPNKKVTLSALAEILTGRKAEFKINELNIFVTDKQSGKKLSLILEENNQKRIFNQIDVVSQEWLLHQVQSAGAEKH